MNRRSSLRGSAYYCAPLVVTAGSSPCLQTKISDSMPELCYVITDIKPELGTVQMKEDPQSEDAVSLDEADQLSDADQFCEDLIPLSNDQVPLTNAQDPLTEVKVEAPELTVDDTKIKVEEVEVTGSGVPTAQKQVLRAADDNANLISIQSQQIAKLTARCNHTQRQLNNMVQQLRRRDHTITCLRAERDHLVRHAAGRGTGDGRLQIQSVNNTVEEKKPNRKLFIVKRVRKSFVKTQPTSVSVIRTSRILRNTSESRQNTSENRQNTPELKRTFDIRENSDTGVKHTLNIIERPSLSIQDKSSVDARRTSRIQKSPVAHKQTSDNRQKPLIAVKPISDIVKSPTLIIQPKSDSRKVSSVRVQRSSVIRRKPSITIKPISEIIENPSLIVQPLSDNRQISSVGVQSPSDNRQKSSLGVQTKPAVRQNSLVIQIDGMHQTVLQPTAVRLDDYKEMG